MKTRLLLLLLVGLTCQVQAQSLASDSYKKAVFVEAFGQGLHGTVNYDMRLKKGANNGFGLRIGIGGIFTGTFNNDAENKIMGVVAFPAGVNYLSGESRSSFEAGIGLAPFYAETDIYSPTKPEFIEKNGWNTNGYLNLGYRFQPIEEGFMFRLSWTPLLSSAGFLAQQFGASAGYSF
ncbi:hypothetical protein POKO110462_05615 [Pontibacter korlensis]|uniref:Outer membrane protein beta-barrel domain-containing protein n=1 Tax=Pontibacter korlensis TaxID=400092 RepID=A0A0E3UXA1_9BACT|nr:hypothetical protein [Pontibacter korlensis]AKD03426.1 hypothetical protein PKOR_10185 [Pontibacter korlensis]